MYQVSCFSLSVTYTYMSLYNVLLEVVCCFFPIYILLNMTLFVRSQSFISPPSFMFASAAVSEIRELNRNKKRKNSEIGSFQFSTFPGHIFLNHRYHLSTCMSTHSLC